MEQQDIQHLLRQTENNRNLLLQGSTSSKNTHFLKDWISFAEFQGLATEQNYIWELVHGWPINNFLGTTTVTPEQPKFTAEPLIRLSDAKVSDKSPNSKAIFAYISKNQAIIRQSQTVFIINPLYQTQDLNQISNQQLQIIIILTVSSFRHIFSVLKIVALRKQAKIITLEPIYKKIKMLIHFFSENYSKNSLATTLQTVYLLKADQYFEYGGFLWLPRRCCWFEPTYDLLVSPNRAKTDHYLIQSPKLSEIKFIYYGWKNGSISQQSYQKYTANNHHNFTTSDKGLVFFINDIEVPDPRKHRFLSFADKQLIRNIDGEDQQEVWACCQPLEFTSGQIITRQNTLFDFVYFLFEGEFEYQSKKDGISNKRADKQKLYGLQQLKTNQTHNGYGLSTVSNCFVMRVSKQNISFLLHDYLY